VCLPLLIYPCTIKSRSSLLAPAHPGGPGKRAVKRLWCGGSFGTYASPHTLSIGKMMTCRWVYYRASDSDECYVRVCQDINAACHNTSYDPSTLSTAYKQAVETVKNNRTRTSTEVKEA